ncbi:MAG TPA: hypothetical protein VLV31_04460 [Candidatus Acidoferrales bacterium]|nr:hypothetical protein [Candidatus Acidoferrales bacterium]
MFENTLTEREYFQTIRLTNDHTLNKCLATNTRKWKRLEEDEQENFSGSTLPTMHDIQSGKGEQDSTIA